MTNETIYKIVFHNQGKIYEIYARDVHQSGMLGFIEVEKLLFDEHTTVVVDPAEEKLKNEFKGVNRSYIPMHSVIRIDEVEKEGTGKITDTNPGENIMPFPVYSTSADTDT